MTRLGRKLQTALRVRFTRAGRIGMRTIGVGRNAAIVVAAAAFAAAQPASAKSCDDLQAVPGSTGYQQRSNSDRCEGLYQTPVAGERLEFLSLSTAPIQYDLAADKVLTVSVPNVGPLKAPAVDVRATALRVGVYYRMDAQVASASAIDWPLETVIAPSQLQPADIGVYGSVKNGSTRVYVPVTVYSKAASPKPSPAAAAVLRSNVDIESVRWRVLPAGSTPQASAWKTLAGPIAAGDAIHIAVPRSLQLQRLEVVAKIANSDDRVTELYRVFDP